MAVKLASGLGAIWIHVNYCAFLKKDKIYTQETKLSQTIMEVIYGLWNNNNNNKIDITSMLHIVRTSIVLWSFCFTCMFVYVCTRLYLRKHSLHCCKLTIKWHIIGNSDNKLAIFMKSLFYFDKEISLASWPCDLQQCMPSLLNWQAPENSKVDHPLKMFHVGWILAFFWEILFLWFFSSSILWF